VVHELPDSEMNIPPHLVAQAVAANAQPEPVSVGVAETVQVSAKVAEGVTVEELITGGVPREIAEKLTPEMIVEIGRLQKNAYTRIWNSRRKGGVTKAEELQLHSAAVVAGKDIQREQAETSIYDIPVIPQVVPASERIKTHKVTKMDANEKRIADLEASINQMTVLMTQLVGKQATPQTFTAAPATPAATVPMPTTRLFTYVRKDNTLGANIAIEPLPANVTQFHNSALFTPGNIANLYAMHKKDPAAFGKNLEEAYAVSFPYQYKKKQ